MKESAITNEKIIAAIIEHGTFADAAKACGITTRTIRDRMADPAFVEEYEAARGDIVRQALANVNSHLSEAVDCIAGIMNDKKAPASVRLSAARSILDTAGRLTEAQNASEKSRKWAKQQAEDPFRDFKELFS